MEKVCIKSMLPGQVQEYMVSLGEPSYRGKQVFRWLTQGVTSFDEMSDLSKSLREKLKEKAFITKPEIVRKQVSARDGTVKYLFGLADGNCVETVVMATASAFPPRPGVIWAAPSAPPLKKGRPGI